MKEEALVGARLGLALGTPDHGFHHSSGREELVIDTWKLLMTAYYGFSIPVSSL